MNRGLVKDAIGPRPGDACTGKGNLSVFFPRMCLRTNRFPRAYVYANSSGYSSGPIRRFHGARRRRWRRGLRHLALAFTRARNPDARLHFEFSRASGHFFRVSHNCQGDRPPSEMLTRYIGRLRPPKTGIVACGAHKCTSILDTASRAAIGKPAKVQGWVRALRKMKDNVFVDISDGSTCEMLQVVMPKALRPDELRYGSSVSVEGDLAVAPSGQVELRATGVRVLGACSVAEDGYPFAPRKKYDPDYVRQYPHLRPRTRGFASLLRLRDLAGAAIVDHLRDRGFISVHTPMLTSNDCEGAGEVFVVRPQSKEILESMRKERDNEEKEGQSEDEVYFGTTAFLTVSGQLHLEAVARALTKVYTFGPTFRAENSKSRLHLSEFYMLEAELAFITRIEELIEEVELLVARVTERMIEKGAQELRAIDAPEPRWLNKPFARVTYDDAFNVLNHHADRLQRTAKYGEAFSKEHELFLVQHNDGVPVFVVNWPKTNKPFYMKECEDDASKVAALDLLAPNVGELVGGSMREDDYGKLQLKLPPTGNLSWYLDLRRYGNVPTGGFGMGFDRFLQSVLGIGNIKDTVPFPRWPHNCNL
ncbi:PREDICTED: probable asparagine--tRNA ligase, mitochondrial [Vollenhovia emeryi]|uniref:probable asparagine--tRNA ligase, mitochondrial n=1 Tax=Vollenhovia emeryi TaxID=411798 RepID=UPI0005F523E3|nr:PREDICTED: probable asparagine--tRNA ligase, mitochondrial [Vollenhovia emeryi]